MKFIKPIVYFFLSAIFVYLFKQSIQAQTTPLTQWTKINSSAQTTNISAKTDIPIIPFHYSAKYTDYLEPGWPVKTYHSAGSYHSGPAIHTLVDTIQDYKKGNIVVSGLASGPLYMFDYQGQLVSGWPVQFSTSGVLYPVSDKRKKIYAGGFDYLAAFNQSGIKLWEKSVFNYSATPPSIGLVYENFIFGLFLEEEDWKLHGYSLEDGSALSGWPAQDPGRLSQEYHTPAIADIDKDGQNEIIAVSGWASNGIRVSVFKENGAFIWGKTYSNGAVDTFPVVGDVDNDNNEEIILISRASAYPWTNYLKVLNSSGEEETTVALSGSVPYGTAPALGDMDGDKIPDIIVQTEGYINVVNIYSPANSWTKTITSGGWIGNSSPVIGDVNGDKLMDIVFTTQENGSSINGYAHVVLNNQIYAEDFPMSLPIGAGAVPAIWDLDQDNHNEVIISGSYWSGAAGDYDKVWVFDLSQGQSGVTHGRIDWSQFGGNPLHTGHYVYPLTD